VSLPEQIERANCGDRAALEEVVRSIQDKVYGLALRMLWHPEDALDATQEILTRVVTHLSEFRGESAFLTWVYRVACNALLSFRRSKLEFQGLTFERFGADLEEGLEDPAPPPDDAILLEEVKIGCTLALLSCLDRHHRLAYVLGEVLELDGPEAAAALEISPEAYRKRLSRARAQVLEFTREHCGLVNPERRCRCRKRVPRAIALGRLDPEHPLFAHDAERARAFPAVLAEIRKLEETRRAAALYRSHPEPRSPTDFAQAVRALVEKALPE
jgi:RNA polymerase sigma factor (sigma-70 family)